MNSSKNKNSMQFKKTPLNDKTNRKIKQNNFILSLWIFLEIQEHFLLHSTFFFLKNYVNN